MSIRLLSNSIKLFIGSIIVGVLLSGCMNWAHVVEHNQLRAIEEMF
jgi:outer membrane murein-binding lipoprotein Lpp